MSNLPFDSNHDVGIVLNSPEACEAELQRCSNGMAHLTQEFTRTEEALSEIREQYDRVEAIVAKSIRDGSDAKLTATEVKARITELVMEDGFFSEVKETLNALEADSHTLERRLKTLEKRESAAQTAMGKHLKEDGLGR